MICEAFFVDLFKEGNMSIRIEEQFLVGKLKSPENCEDSIFVSDNFVAVIDGATSKNTFQFGNRTTGKLAADLILNTLDQFHPEISAALAVRKLTESIQSFYLSHQLMDKVSSNPVGRLSASVVIFSRYKNEIWSVGDCQFLMNGKVYQEKKTIDEITSGVRSLILEEEISKGIPIAKLQYEDPGREVILPLLKRQMLFQNQNYHHEFSYGLIDGFEVASHHINVYPVESNEIVLASDGYPRLFSTLKESEAELQKILREDPLCYKINPSTKGLKPGNNSFDDRAYIRFKIDSP